MGVLYVRLFGRMRAMHNEGGPELKMTPTAQTLLAYLLLRRSYCPRDVLACLCWGEEPEHQARSCLSTALWRLRRALEPEGIPPHTYLLTGSSGEVSFNWQSDHWVDLYSFECCANSILKQPLSHLGASDITALEAALSLYTGDLLEGLYDDWALRERERVRSEYLDCLTRLMEYHCLQGAYDSSLIAGQRILALDPAREAVHRQMMRLYAASGQRALAVRQYRHCCEILRDELGVGPMTETTALFHQIAPDADAEAESVMSKRRMALTAALREVRDTISQYETTRDHLTNVARLLEAVLDCDNPTARQWSSPSTQCGPDFLSAPHQMLTDLLTTFQS